jgi:4-amino-4-deoxy-L-arabinose transferase-like glycosyltransferase
MLLHKKTPLWILALLMIVSGSIMLSVAWQESGITDELAHIPAGYSYARYLDYRLNPEHPPVVKFLSAVPLLFMHLSFPTDHYSWTEALNGQWEAGNQFIYHYNGDRAEQIVFASRIFPILLTLLLVWFVYWWAKRIVGSWWALVPTFFVALSPHILAHGHYVTTDIGAALGFIMGLYFFARLMEAPKISYGIWAGIAFGCAQLLKFSLVLLIPIVLFLTLVHWWAKTREQYAPLISRKSLQLFWHHTKKIFLMLFVGYLVVWAVYVVFTINYPIQRQRADTIEILSSFANGPDQGLSECLPQHLSKRCLAEIDITLSSIPVLRGAGHYLLGVLMVIQRSAGGNTAYFLGEITNTGWWYYFPAVFVLKSPLPSLLLLLGGLFIGISQLWKRIRTKQRRTFSQYLSLNFDEFVMWTMLVVYWLYSIQSTLNIGFRHILPTLPFMFILAVKAFRTHAPVSNREWGTPLSALWNMLKRGAGAWVKTAIVVLLCVWLAAEVVFAYPFYLSYFNPIGGGVDKGYASVTDSNYDWGQDMKRLRTFVQDNNIEKIAVDYFGAADIAYYLGDAAIRWDAGKGNPMEQGIEWIAISINSLQSTHAVPGPYFIIDNPSAYDFITNYQYPTAKAGTSIFIFHLGDK